jgi:hypothetical protein
MMNLNGPTRRLLSALVSAALSSAVGGCGDDNNDNTNTATAGESSAVTGAGSRASGAKAGSVSPDPNLVAACPGKVYSPLSTGCRASICGTDPQLAPSCQKPCWDFLACSSAAQTGKCASFAAGGAAMRPQFEACTMGECGAQLAVPGAEVVSAYRPVIAACAVAMGDAKAPCSDDVAKFISELK